MASKNLTCQKYKGHYSNSNRKMITTTYLLDTFCHGIAMALPWHLPYMFCLLCFLHLNLKCNFPKIYLHHFVPLMSPLRLPTICPFSVPPSLGPEAGPHQFPDPRSGLRLPMIRDYFLSDRDERRPAADRALSSNKRYFLSLFIGF